MNRTVVLPIGLILLALLMFFCVRSHAPSIQDDIRTRTSEQLSNTRMEWAKVEADGRNVVLTGLASTELLREKAGEVAGSVTGVLAADNQITVTRPEPIATLTPYETRFSKDDSGIILSGNVPDDEQRSLLVRLAREKAGAGNVVDRMEIVPGEPSGWHRAAQLGLGNLAAFERGVVHLAGTEVNLSGRMLSVESKSRLQEQFEKGLPANYEVAYELSVVQEAVGLETSSEPEAAKLAISCAEEFDVQLAAQRIYFPTNSLDLDADAIKVLEKILEYSTLCPDARIEVSGHTDAHGVVAYNQELSRARAQSVVDMLVKKGVLRDKLEAAGYGESQPRADNANREGRYLNRRIEFKYLHEGG